MSPTLHRETTNPFLSGLQLARSALCPIIGYNGSFCPGGNRTNSIQSRQLLSSVLLPLPKSVGMAIDISTGDILLPALEISEKTSTTWTDPESGQVFYVPDEVKVDPPSSNDNNISVRIFDTENELFGFWLRGNEAGSWTGAEFARRKAVSDVYNQFFKDNQAISILQDLRVMYTISIPDDKTKLNHFAQRAVDMLTSKYDAALYDSFLDAWGTHVTVSNQVGGMTEQQVQFKSCIMNRTEFTEGLLSSNDKRPITRSSLEYNLKQELLYKRPCLDHYYWLRRKKLLDHRVGGDVTISNNTVAWQKTIAYNPALLAINKYIPWYDLVKDATVKANLKQAIINRINTTNAQRQIQAEKIRTERANMELQAKVFFLNSWYYDDNYQNIWHAAGESVTLMGSLQCPTTTESNIQCLAGLKRMSACSKIVHYHYTKLRSVYSNQNGDQWINNRLGKSREHTYRLAANIQPVELAFILLDQYYLEYKYYNDHKADNIFRLRMIDLANRFLNRIHLSERVQLDIHFQVVQSAINTVLMNINQYECFFSGYGLTRKPHNMVNDEEISPSSTDDGDQQQTNFTESVMISPGNGGEVQRKRHHTNSSDLYEEENLDKVEMDVYISNDKHYSKRSKLKKSSSMDDRVRSITEKILQFKHIGFTLCQISSYSSKWKDEREKAINQLCDLNLLIRIPRGVKTSTSRPFDYHIKLPPLDFSDFTECDKRNHQYSMVDQVYSSMNDQTSAVS
ncbi:unnamed protein product [Didymodactylos carnosus]|uniref:MACPF domain-containing protein n=1 Tax=Didymodactylos carnosus TaxID=1234261 RepID=A0A814MV60_9BILA|nr:unnamed protein product [Didymodactylos carnosus]CAF3850506.1 unnamed protein product [Didymodactylos carnosus]